MYLRLLEGSELPRFLKVWWIGCVPIASALALELLWEKTWLTWQHGPQMVGFRIFHVWPIPVIAAWLASYATVAWLPVALCWVILKRQRWHHTDTVMFLLATLVIVQGFVPDEFGLRFVAPR